MRDASTRSVCGASGVLAILLPGTLSMRLEGGVLTVHVLDLGLPVAETLERVEARVAAVFGEPL